LKNRLPIGLLVPLLLASHALADAQVMGQLEAFTHEVDEDTRILLCMARRIGDLSQSSLGRD